jgi:hypothetical protein
MGAPLHVCQHGLFPFLQLSPASKPGQQTIRVRSCPTAAAHEAVQLLVTLALAGQQAANKQFVQHDACSEAAVPGLLLEGAMSLYAAAHTLTKRKHVHLRTVGLAQYQFRGHIHERANNLQEQAAATARPGPVSWTAARVFYRTCVAFISCWSGVLCGAGQAQAGQQRKT